MDVARTVGDAFGQLTGFDVRLRDPDVEVVVVLDADCLTLGLALGPRQFGWRTPFVSEGRPLLSLGDRLISLRPSTAWAMAALAHISPGQVVVDTMGGLGTIPVEVFANWPSVLAWSLDKDEAVTTLAASNAAYARQRLVGEAAGVERPGPPAEHAASRPACLAPRPRGSVVVVRADATRLPLRPGCVDACVVDLPFGMRSGRPGVLGRVYTAMVRELARVARPGARVVLLGPGRRPPSHSGGVGSLVLRGPRLAAGDHRRPRGLPRRRPREVRLALARRGPGDQGPPRRATRPARRRGPRGRGGGSWS